MRMTGTTHITYRALITNAHNILPIKATTLENERGMKHINTDLSAKF
jgi:hypothetical protein